MRRRGKKMFFGTENIKVKNFFVLCDAIGHTGTCTRKTIAEITALSYPTVSKTVELLLDMGIIREKSCGKNYVYSFNEKSYFAVADMRGTFRMTLTDLGGTELYSSVHKEADTFFFDEKLSLFFRDTSILAKRKLPKGKLCGVCVILPSLSEAYRDTRSVLTSSERLKKLISSYFNCTNIITVTAADAVTEMCSKKRCLIILKEPCGVLCKVCGYGWGGLATLKSVSTTALGRCRTSEELAKEIACAVGNICGVFSPEDIYIDGDRLFSVSAFPRRFKEALARFNCVSEDSLPEIICSGGSLTVTAGARILRHRYIEDLITNAKEINNKNKL